MPKITCLNDLTPRLLNVPPWAKETNTSPGEAKHHFSLAAKGDGYWWDADSNVYRHLCKPALVPPRFGKWK